MSIRERMSRLNLMSWLWLALCPAAALLLVSGLVAAGAASSLSETATVAHAPQMSAAKTSALPSTAQAPSVPADGETSSPRDTSTQTETASSWVRTLRPTTLWSGTDARAERFNEIPADVTLKVHDSGTSGGERLLVEYAGDGGTRKPGMAWVARADVAPVPEMKEASLGMGPLFPAGLQVRALTSRDLFVEAVGATARKTRAVTGVPASVAVAQAILESDWGRSRLARDANNLFGVKATGKSGLAGSVNMPTWEHLNGKDVTIRAAFRAYSSLEESVEDHGLFLLRNKRYAGALAVAKDPKAFARAIQQAGYATDPAYADKLIRLMDRYNLYRFDV